VEGLEGEEVESRRESLEELLECGQDGKNVAGVGRGTCGSLSDRLRSLSSCSSLSVASSSGGYASGTAGSGASSFAASRSASWVARPEEGEWHGAERKFSRKAEPMLTAELVCSWAERYNFVPSSRVVVQSIPPLSTSLEADFTDALGGTEHWCKRRVYLHELDVLRPNLSAAASMLKTNGVPVITYITCGVVDFEPSRKKSRQKNAMKRRHKLATRFTWTGSGNTVGLSGSFNNWSRVLNLQKTLSGTREVVVRLSPGVYDYRYLVDGEWLVDSSKLVVSANGEKLNRVIAHLQKPAPRDGEDDGQFPSHYGELSK